ncbi:MAG TPA: radical SAM protein [Phycisphaerales bacterium]|nr:radical SAM protein [Phycisphaerales bacterium]
MLRACTMCEKRCGIDRTAGQPAPCHLNDQTYCFKRHVSYAEELELIPSYMVYLGGCNFRCRFCVQAPHCFVPDLGSRLEPGEAAADFRRVVGRGAKTINLLGGEPSLHLHTILEIAAENAEAGHEPLPLALNTNMYMSPEVIDLLDGVVDLYIADFKFGTDACAKSIAGMDRYVEVVTRNLLLASARTRVVVRHLVMPGHLECCLNPVAAWMCGHLPAAAFTLMTGYVPAWQAARRTDELGRCLTQEEREKAERLAAALALAPGG